VLSDCAVWCRCVRPEQHQAWSAVVFVMFCVVASGCVRLHERLQSACAGGVYSYYEFTNPPAQRLNDTEWRAKLDAGTAPPRPTWEQAMFPK
jgi:hypothetical protein